MASHGLATEPSRRIRSHRDMKVYQESMKLAMEIFRLTQSFPREEIYSLTTQMRRSSRSVVINFVEAWRKRRYEAAFVSKLSDCETESAETQGHIEFAVRCEYISPEIGRDLYRRYDRVMRTLVGMIEHADRWLIKPSARKK